MAEVHQFEHYDRSKFEEEWQTVDKSAKKNSDKSPSHAAPGHGKKKNSKGNKPNGAANGSGKAEAAAASSSASKVSPAPVAANGGEIVEVVQIRAGKALGTVIGPQGSHIKGIEGKTGVAIDCSGGTGKRPGVKVDVLVKGRDRDMVTRAVAYVHRLLETGNVAFLQDEPAAASAPATANGDAAKTDNSNANASSNGNGNANTTTTESMMVPRRYLSEIVGVGGITISRLKETYSVEVSVPSERSLGKVNKRVNEMVAITLTGGSAEQRQQTRDTIQTLMTVHCTALTHPGMTYDEVAIDPRYFKAIIGPKGAVIQEIQRECEVTIYLPSPEASQSKVVVVGKDGRDIQDAIDWILEVVADVDADNNTKDKEASNEETASQNTTHDSTPSK